MAQDNNNRPKKSTGPDGMTPGEKKGMWATLVLGTLGIGTIIVAFWRDIQNPAPKAEEPKAGLKVRAPAELKGKAITPPEKEKTEKEKSMELIRKVYDRFPKENQIEFRVKDYDGKMLVRMITSKNDPIITKDGVIIAEAGEFSILLGQDGKMKHSSNFYFPDAKTSDARVQQGIEDISDKSLATLSFEESNTVLVKRSVDRKAVDLSNMIKDDKLYDEFVGFLNKVDVFPGLKYPNSKELEAFKREEKMRQLKDRGILRKDDGKEGMGR